MVVVRFRECWYVWLANNLIDVSIWIVNAIKGIENAEMALVTSIMYLVMNIVGLICWMDAERKQKIELNNENFK